MTARFGGQRTLFFDDSVEGLATRHRKTELHHRRFGADFPPEGAWFAIAGPSQTSQGVDDQFGDGSAANQFQFLRDRSRDRKLRSRSGESILLSLRERRLNDRGQRPGLHRTVVLLAVGRGGANDVLAAKDFLLKAGQLLSQGGIVRILDEKLKGAADDDEDVVEL